MGGVNQQTVKLAEAQGWRCAYCGVRMLWPRPTRQEKQAALGTHHKRQRGRAAAMRIATQDHIVPRCDGGSDAMENKVAACRWCNEYRGNRDAQEAFKRIARFVRQGRHPHQIWAAHGFFHRYSNMMQIRHLPAGNSTSTTTPGATL